MIRESLIAAGYFESLTFSFVSDNLAEDFRPGEAASLLRADPSVRAGDGRLRPSIIPGLLQAIRHNESNGTLGAHLFEIGSTFWLDKNGKKPAFGGEAVKSLSPAERQAVILRLLPEIRGRISKEEKKLDKLKPKSPSTLFSIVTSLFSSIGKYLEDKNERAKTLSISRIDYLKEKKRKYKNLQKR